MPLLLPRYKITQHIGDVTAEVVNVIYFENRYSVRGPASECNALYYETEDSSGELTLHPGDRLEMILTSIG